MLLGDLLTWVGDCRVSIGPPIIVSEAGTQLSRHPAINAVATIAGTDGWQTAKTCVFQTEEVQEINEVIYIVVEIDDHRRDHARIQPVGHIDILGCGLNSSARKREVTR